MEIKNDRWKEQLALDSSYWNIPVNLPSRRFKAFSRKLDRQLQQLIKRYHHLAATPQVFAWRQERDGTSTIHLGG